MLKSYLIVLALFTNLSVIAQQYQLDSVVHNINGNQLMVSQKYDAENRKAELIRYKRQGTNDAIQKTERTELIYDDKGNELYHVFSVWNSINNKWDEEEKTEQEFNTDNHLIRLSTYRKNNNKWLKVFENKKTYTQDSIIETDYEIKNDKFQPIHKNISVINSFGKIKTYEIFLWNDKSQIWTPLVRTTNNYQNDTIMIGFETIEWNENQWQKQEKVVYELDKNNRPTENYTLYKGHNNQWIPNLKFEEKSLPQQSKKTSSTYKWDDINNKWILNTQIETNFNDEGKKQDVLFSEIDTKGQLNLQLEQLNLYDKKGRLTLFQDFTHSDEIKTGIQNTFKFDEVGNLIQENLYDLDSEKETWNNKMTTEFLYDKNIKMSMVLEDQKRFDLFNLNVYNSKINKEAIKQVKIYSYDTGKKVLSEEFEYFYSITK